ncbi:MAG: oligoendopeptidase F [Chthoniobacterales bacterium]
MHDVSENTSRGVPNRSEVRADDTWNLIPLYASAQDWEDDFKGLQADYVKVADFKGRVGESAETLLAVLEFEKTVDMRIERLNQYAALIVVEDAANADSLSREARLQNTLTRVGEAFAFLSPEIQAISDDRFETFLSDSALEEWKIALRKVRRFKPHTLTAGEERIMALGAAVLGGHEETFSQLTNVDMKFGKLVDEKGEERDLTQSSFSSFLVQRDPEIRRKAFHQFYEGFSGHQYSLASSLVSSIRGDVFRARARNYPAACAAALFRDDMPMEVYDNLITAVHANLDPLFRYFDLRKRVLGLSEIHHYDTYVPMVGGVQTNISFDEASDKVLSALHPLGEEYIRTLGAGLRSERWCDRYENKGKRSGAFSYGTYTSPPYIMMNYKTDVFSDIYTLAHEAGHSMHTWYSQRHQRYQDYHYPIFLAEVASTFNEMLLTEHLLKTTEDTQMRAYLINRQLDDLRGTLYRQTMFAEFEKLSHAAEESGEALTLETLRKLYRGLLTTYFGPNFVIDEVLELECLRIPHFYSAFYVYKYATGISAAAALAEQVVSTGDVSRYLNFLKSGGSKYPIETLAAAGVDMRSPAPIESTLRLFARRLDELEKLLLA